MINGITLIKLRNAEFAQFVSDILEIVRRNDPAALQAQEGYDTLKAENKQLITMLKPIKGSPFTVQLEAADARRDESVSGINAVVGGYTLHYDPVIRGHAVTLQRLLDTYGGAAMARENYQSETASINSLTKDLSDKPEMVAALTALNLSAWRDEMKEANDAFNTLYLSRNEETGVSSPDTVKSKRLSMCQDWYTLRDLISAHNVINKGAVPYGTTVSQINALIDNYQALITSRKSRSKSTKEVEVVSMIDL